MISTWTLAQLFFLLILLWVAVLWKVRCQILRTRVDQLEHAVKVYARTGSEVYLWGSACIKAPDRLSYLNLLERYKAACERIAGQSELLSKRVERASAAVDEALNRLRAEGCPHSD